MKFRAIVAVAVLAAASLAPTAARAADKAAKPALILRLKSLDGLLTDVRYLAKQAGQEEMLDQLDGALKAFATDGVLGGIDMKRPIALYGDVSANPQDSAAVLLLPVADEKAFLEFLGNFQIKPEKGDDGVYTVENVPNVPVPLYFRFANKYAYVTAMSKDNIAAKTILKPEQVVFAAGDSSAISLALRLDAIPDTIKQFAFSTLETQLEEAKKQKVENETPAAKAFRLKAVEYFGGEFKAILTDGEELSLRAGLDAKTDDLSVDFSFKAKKDSKLAKDIETAGKGTSMFGSLGKGAALQATVALGLPEDVRKLLGPIIDEGIKEAVAQEKDMGKAALAKKALEALAPTLKAGELDGAMALTGPDKDGRYTAVVGLKVKDAKRVEDVIREVVSTLPANEREKVQLDAATIGDAKVHKLLFDEKDENMKKLFGTSGAYLAFKNDAVLVALGPDAMKALKDAASAKPTSAPLLNVTLSLGQLAALNPADKKAQKAAEEVFGKSPAGNDAVALTVEMGEVVKLKLSMKGKVIAFGMKSQKDQ